MWITAKICDKHGVEYPPMTGLASWNSRLLAPHPPSRPPGASKMLYLPQQPAYSDRFPPVGNNGLVTPLPPVDESQIRPSRAHIAMSIALSIVLLLVGLAMQIAAAIWGDETTNEVGPVVLTLAGWGVLLGATLGGKVWLVLALIKRSEARKKAQLRILQEHGRIPDYSGQYPGYPTWPAQYNAHYGYPGYYAAPQHQVTAPTPSDWAAPTDPPLKQPPT